uniref:Uncharacterized protein n=1 Tax=Kalanchoe fedtschenkoi TaxID=63787 RepID=A0A7N0T0B8_KALFE
MGLSKTEVNLRRLLAAAPRQQNQAKLIHYVATMRELLEQLSLESTPDGLPSVSKAMLSEFSEKIEAIASTVVPQLPELQVSRVNFAETSIKLSPTKTGEAVDQFTPSSPGLRRRHVHFEDRTHTTSDANHSATVKLDSKAHAHIEKHRYSIQLRKQLSRAWPAQIALVPVPWQSTQRLRKLPVSLGF